MRVLKFVVAVAVCLSASRIHAQVSIEEKRALADLIQVYEQKVKTIAKEIKGIEDNYVKCGENNTVKLKNRQPDNPGLSFLSRENNGTLSTKDSSGTHWSIICLSKTKSTLE